MKVLIDANIILDVLQKREPHLRASAIVWKLCETKKITGYVSLLSFMNIVYILRKELTPEKIKEVFYSLSMIFTFEDLTEDDIKSALIMGLPDFEDSVQMQTAYRVRAEFIIARNVKDFLKSSIPAYTPLEFLERIDI
ncbi:PIN domain-containing protein [Succinivibrio dextrinosolvens]|uniref:PIN domain-containing protein n=1 Tax=Succinivibrio dextrinosolvens TaxID=83771 RepID=UPI001921A050|nr:PIN domain-containing protein [Succinivibrio dextrinosolvens]